MKLIQKTIFSLLIIFCFCLIHKLPIFADQNQDIEEGEAVKGVVIEVLEENEIEIAGSKQFYQKLEITLTNSSLKGKTIAVENGNFASTNIRVYKTGDKLLLTYAKDADGNDLFFISDYQRGGRLLALFIFFAVVAILVASKNGAFSLISMAVSFLILLKFILPQILAGRDPVLIVIIASFFLIPITFYLSHGLEKETTVAIFGTIISLVITGILAQIAVEAAYLSGISSEEAIFLQGLGEIQYDLKGILLAGIIISVVGVLDDITIAQTSVVYRLFETDNSLNFKKLYSKSIKVGKNHIASMINTLVLVYAGASLPLLLLFINNSRSFVELLNYEIVAAEIVRTLVGSAGLILAVPITTSLACYFAIKSSNQMNNSDSILG